MITFKKGSDSLATITEWITGNKEQETMKPLIEKLQIKLDFIRERSRENQKEFDMFRDPLCKGYSDAYELTAGWIQEIIDYELQDNEK